MQLLSIQVPEAYITGIDILILSGYFPNRSEAIRSAVKDMIVNELGGFKGIKESHMLVQGIKASNVTNNEEINGL